jgi:transposase
VSTQRHLRAEGGGKRVTAGQRPEPPQFVPLREPGAVQRAGRGRPRLRPRRVAGDKASSRGQGRRDLRRRGSGAVIPRKAHERRTGRFDRVAYRERHRVERLINRLQPFRRVATRYEKLAVSYLAMVTLAAILMWL